MPAIKTKPPVKMKKPATGKAPGKSLKGEGPIGEREWAFKLVDTAPYLVCLCRKGRIEYVNAIGRKWLGLRSMKKALGLLFANFIHGEERKDFSKKIKTLPGRDEKNEVRLIRGKNKVIFTEMVWQNLDAKDPDVLMIQAHDITERKLDEERILYQANYDRLTGLPNRSLFLDRLNQTLASAKRSKTNVGVMFIDLDGFKLVNDTLGHDMGDLLLKETSGRLEECVRASDTVARMGGDEFTVLMPSLNDPRDAPLVAQRILDSVAKPFHMEGHEAFVSASIGITVFPTDAADAGGLLKNADSAMYLAKDQGKANYQFFTEELNQDMKERLVLKNGLAKAMDNREMKLFFQPKIDLASGAISGVEALMRWQSPELGTVSPGRFIPVLEETGMVVEFGAWAIRVACQQHRDWIEAGLPPVRVAVNLSTRQLREISFVSVFEQAFKDTGVGPESLEIEITESMLMADARNTVATIKRLHDMGISVAMDDFGTGYSSLSVLKRFPIDSIKMDHSFVAEITTNPDDAEIIRAIITMGKTLNRKIIAEGVETQEQVDLLRVYGCDQIQGYFIHPPAPAPELTKYLKTAIWP